MRELARRESRSPPHRSPRQLNRAVGRARIAHEQLRIDSPPASSWRAHRGERLLDIGPRVPDRDRDLTDPWLSPARILRALRVARPRFPPQLALRRVWVKTAVVHLAQSAPGANSPPGAAVLAADVVQRIDQLEHGGLPTRADVDRTRYVRHRRQAGSPVRRPPPRPSRASGRRRRTRSAGAPSSRQPQKIATTPGLAVDVLARPVDVAVAQRDGRETMEAVVQLAVALGGELRLTVGGERMDRMVLGGRPERRLRRRGRRRWSC